MSPYSIAIAIINAKQEQYVTMESVVPYAHQIENVLTDNYVFKEYVNQLVIATLLVQTSNIALIIFAPKKYDVELITTVKLPKIVFKIRMVVLSVKILVTDEHCADEMLNVMLEITMLIAVVKQVLLAIQK